MPLPIVPAPITPTVFMSMIVPDVDGRKPRPMLSGFLSITVASCGLKMSSALGSDYHTAIHRNHGPVNEAGLVGSQPEIRIGHVFRCSGPPQGSSRHHGFENFGGHRPHHVRSNEPWSH